LEPKTAEERREELAKEALGIEDDGGILDEMLEEIPEETLQDKIGEMLTDDEKLKEDLEEELQEILLTDNGEIKEIKENSEEELPEIVAQEKLTKMYLDKQYVPFDMKA
ncbi:MAG: hypothetical protein K2M91_03105, partial [Lachnospiraceae bacterium]|nr:hypothetical protein [Lachnospiraceae bacterium]